MMIVGSCDIISFNIFTDSKCRVSGLGSRTIEVSNGCRVQNAISLHFAKDFGESLLFTSASV